MTGKEMVRNHRLFAAVFSNKQN